MLGLGSLSTLMPSIYLDPKLMKGWCQSARHFQMDCLGCQQLWASQKSRCTSTPKMPDRRFRNWYSRITAWEGKLNSRSSNNGCPSSWCIMFWLDTNPRANQPRTATQTAYKREISVFSKVLELKINREKQKNTEYN